MLLCCLWATGPARAAQTPAHRTLRVTASRAPALLAPVSITVPAPAWARSLTLQDDRGRTVACDATISGGRAQLTWLVADLAQGASRTYRLDFGRVASATRPAVTVEMGEATARVLLGGKPFTSYVFAGAPKPYLYPLIGPNGHALTRSFPMEEVAGEPRDHPHQRSLWFTHGDVNGVDFWTEGEQAGRIVHRGFIAAEPGKVCARLRTRNDWLGPKGKVCEDEREIRLWAAAPQGGRMLDFEITIKATQGPLRFGDTKEGTMGVRLLPSLQVAGGGGHIVTAEGKRDAQAWGTRAAWCDYWGPVAGETAGIAIFDHPDNLRHPTWWHVRDYGLFAANPFGQHDFERVPGEPGAYTLPQGKSLTFRYRLYLHAGDTDTARVAAAYADYATPPTVELK